MQETTKDTTAEEPQFERNPGRFNRNGQHWVYLSIAALFFTLTVLLIINFLLIGQLNIFLLATNTLGLFVTMYCHTRYFRRNDERAPWHYWKIFQNLRR